MPSIHNLRSVIKTLLNALHGEAIIGEGIALRIDPHTPINLEHRTEPSPTATLRFHPPPVIVVQREPFRIRCSLTAVVIGFKEVRLAIDGWFDQRWQVSSWPPIAQH